MPASDSHAPGAPADTPNAATPVPPHGTWSGRFGEPMSERMQRFNAPTTIKLTVSSSAIKPDGFEIDVYNTLGEAFRLTAIRPEPAQAAALADRMRLRFAAPTGQDATIYFYASPDSIGLARLHLGLGGDDPLQIAMFIYP